MNGIIRMVIRVFLVKGLFAVVNKGSMWWANRRASKQSPEEAALTREQGRKTAKNANQLIRTLRRFSRF